MKMRPKIYQNTTKLTRFHCFILKLMPLTQIVIADLWPEVELLQCCMFVLWCRYRYCVRYVMYICACCFVSVPTWRILCVSKRYVIEGTEVRWLFTQSLITSCMHANLTAIFRASSNSQVPLILQWRLFLVVTALTPRGPSYSASSLVSSTDVFIHQANSAFDP